MASRCAWPPSSRRNCSPPSRGRSFFFFLMTRRPPSSTLFPSTTLFRSTDAPVAANDDIYTPPEDTQLTVSAPGVLANDTDADGDALTAVLVSGPSHGTLTLNADGSL